MKIIDYIWTPTVNHAIVICNCGSKIAWPLNYDLIRCPNCYQEAWTHLGGLETWKHLYTQNNLPKVAKNETSNSITQGFKYA